MMAEHRLSLSHTTIMRWVDKFAPAVEKLWTKFTKTVDRSWGVKESYIKVKGRWVYLYGAVVKAD